MHELHGMCESEVCGVMVQVGHCSGVGVFFVIVLWMGFANCAHKWQRIGWCGRVL